MNALPRIVLVNPNTSAATTEAMVAIAREAAAGAADLVGLTARFGAPLITDEAALSVAADAVLALSDEIAGLYADGVIVAAFGDPGLSALRDRLACPVTGIAEAGMAEAATGGRAFAVVTTTPALADAIDAAARRYGHGASYLGVELTPGDPGAVMADEAGLLAALDAACRRAIDTRGAQALVIGGGPLARAARALRPRFDVPIIEPVPAAMRLAIARCRLAA